jgi:hypothetical protein
MFAPVACLKLYDSQAAEKRATQERGSLRSDLSGKVAQVARYFDRQVVRNLHVFCDSRDKYMAQTKDGLRKGCIRLHTAASSP